MIHNHATWTILRADASAMWIEDLDEGKSITNDAEWVVQILHAKYPDRRIFYKDTMGNWDELVHNDGVFSGFKPAREFAL